MSKTRVIIVEDEPHYQAWLEKAIQSFPDFEWVDTFASGEAALEQIPAANPDLVLMDIKLEGEMSGIECMLRLRLLLPDLKMMVLSSHSAEDKVFEALKVGAGAYLLKMDLADSLEKDMLEFMNGGAPMSPEIAQKVISSFHKPPKHAFALAQLTDRERLILQLLAQGLLYKEIAAQLPSETQPGKFIAEGTVKVHVHNIYQKLQVNNRAEAMRIYLGI